MNLAMTLAKVVVTAILATSAVIMSPVTAGMQVEQPVILVATTSTPVIAVSLPKKQNSTLSGDCKAYEGIINKYDWPTTTAMRICGAESNGVATAINWGDSHYDRAGNLICVSSRGLMQIACIHPAHFGYTLDDLIIPEKNIEIAYQIYLQSGFQPWSTY